MRVITFNIRCCDDPNGHSIAERAPRLKTVLQEQDPDIIGFQEVTPVWESYIFSGYPEYACYLKYRDAVSREGCALLWKKDKYDLIDTGVFWCSKTPWVSSMGADEKYHCKRICIYAILSEHSTGKRFAVWTTHFGFGDAYQAESLRLLSDTVNVVGEKRNLICGDFNFTPESPVYATAVHCFADANIALHCDSTTTYHGYGKMTDARIDYLFFKGDVVPRDYCLVDKTVEGKYPSDHYGLCFDVALSGEK